MENQDAIRKFPTQTPLNAPAPRHGGTDLKCANCGKSLPNARRLKAYCSYACRGQSEVHKGTADRSGLIGSKNTKQNKALQSLKRRSVGVVTFTKINSVTIRVDHPRRVGAGWLIEVAWSGAVRRRWIARVGDGGSEPLALDAAKRAAVAFFRERGGIEGSHKLNQIAANEVDRASLQQVRRRWPIDLVNGRRRGCVEQREAIIDAELAVPSEDGLTLQGDACVLDNYAGGHPKLPECLRRTAARFSDPLDVGIQARAA